MLTDALSFLVQTACEFFAGLLLMRFWLQRIRAPIHNPLSQFVQALTNFIVVPARRVIPGIGGMDLASLFLAWLVIFIEAFILIKLRGFVLDDGTAVAGILAFSGVLLLRLAVYLAIIALIVLCVASWVNPHSWLGPLFAAITRPLLRPIQRIVPLVGNFDLSPLIALVICQLLLMVPLAYLENLALQLMR